MAEIVGAFAASHSPLFLLRHDMPAEDVQEEVFSGYRRMAREIAERGAEALVLLGNDHLHAFSLDRYPALAVGAGPRFGPVETEPFLPRDVYEGAEAPASHLVRGLLESGFDPLLCRELTLDHSFVSPLALMGDTGLPIVPILQNTVAPPLPPAARFIRSRRIAQAIDRGLRGPRARGRRGDGRAIALDWHPRAGRGRRGVGPQGDRHAAPRGREGPRRVAASQDRCGRKRGKRDQDVDIRRRPERRHGGESVDIPDRTPVVSGGDDYRVAHRACSVSERRR